MENFMIGFNAVMPLIMYLLIGYAFNRLGMISQSAFEDFNRALFAILLPINLFINIYQSDFSSAFSPEVLTYILLFALLGFITLAVIIPVFIKDNRKRGVMLQGAIRSNAILFGLPLGTALLGEHRMGMVSIVIATIVPLWNILSVVALSIYTDEKISIKKLLQKIVTNPMVIATLLGIFSLLIGLVLPTFIEATMTNINRMVSPLALMVMGGTFQVRSVRFRDIPLVFTVVSKLMLVPAFALLGGVLLGFRGEAIIAVLIAMAGPTAVSSYPQAVAAGGDGNLANQIVVFTTILSMFSLVFWIALAKSLALF
ncbi:AEC family transporter [Aerococcus kribbianus]|uniref:AEC family transporter n=1 Tax=Aerococcus kribbianus TaxID=2999064 RepID=A0A9X3FP98_9LACT|nr:MULTISPECIES: AEC family transporter [unclassified Aerococcus]MCZ0718033.1 AEC family transporter [Aerococcus sp. YH-aer221]MCZ0726398.1 AEC family transporter [Aerococcus sp. YH-aer222]